MQEPYYTSSQDGNDGPESPILPASQIRMSTLPQRQPHRETLQRVPEEDAWTPRQSTTANLHMIPQPLFSPVKSAAETAASPAAPPSMLTPTNVATLDSPTPTSPSPSLFPLPPSSEATFTTSTSSPVTVSPLSFHRTNSLSRASEFSVSNLTVSTRTGTYPASPVFQPNMLVGNSDNTNYTNYTNYTITTTGGPGFARSPLPNHIVGPTTTMPMGTANTSSSPRSTTITTTDWPVAQAQAPVVITTQQVPFPAHVQVPRLRSPTIPLERGPNRHRPTLSTIVAGTNYAQTQTQTQTHVHMVSLPRTQETNWPLQRPAPTHMAPERNERAHHVDRTQEPETNAGTNPHTHAANKPSVSSSVTRVGSSDHHHQHHHHHRQLQPQPQPPSSSALAEQRSGWWSDDEDEGEEQHQHQHRQQQGRFSTRNRGATDASASTYMSADKKDNASYEVLEMREKQGREGRRRRAKRMKIVLAMSIVTVVVAAGIVAGVSIAVK